MAENENELENLLIAQIEALQKNIERMTNLLVNKELQYRAQISGKFRRLVNPLTDALDTIKQRLLDRNTRPTDDDLRSAWQTFLDTQQRVQRVFSQCLDYIGGIAVRKWELDEQICLLAETLVSEHLAQGASWGSVTIMADDHLPDEVAQKTQIIRLPFPEWDIWSLPFTAYEFGRWTLGEGYIEGLSDVLQNEQQRLEAIVRTPDLEELIRTRALAASDVENGAIQGLAPEISELRNLFIDGGDVSLRLRDKLSQHEAYIKEFFADAFATYFLGPAYPYAKICLRLNPTTAFEDRPLEPSLARRVAIMLGVLAKMSGGRGGDGGGPYNPEIKCLRALWKTTIKMTQPEYEAELAYGKPYDAWAETLYGKLVATYRNVGFSHQDWKAAETWGEVFIIQGDEPDESITVPIVLNAAWYGRVRSPRLLASIERQARKQLQKILDGTGDDESRSSRAKSGPQTRTVTG